MIATVQSIPVSQYSDTELIKDLRDNNCELIVGRTGSLSVFSRAGEPTQPLVLSLIREAFRRHARLTPYARVNGIKLRALGTLSDAA